jgi:hypothetical protein
MGAVVKRNTINSLMALCYGNVHHDGRDHDRRPLAQHVCDFNKHGWSLDNKLVNYSAVSEQNFRANDHTNFHSTMRCLDSSIPYRSVKTQRTNVNMYMNSLSAF